jgi:flagellar motility protein MotE (MotC chaperone)
MRKNDFIAIILVTLLTFPILYVGMLFYTGSLRLEYGFPQEDAADLKVEEIRHTRRRDSLSAENSKVFQAMLQERADIQRERERLLEIQERLEMFQNSIDGSRAELVNERKQLESKLAVNPDAERARYKQLARLYGAMKPAEAAGILETLPDAQVTSILTSINDDRQRARIVSLLTKEKAARISRLIK